MLPKQDIKIWMKALAAYDTGEFDSALDMFAQIATTFEILFNIGMINATIGQHSRAVAAFRRAIDFDHPAVAYFQQGVSNLLMLNFEEALANFDYALHYLGDEDIDYRKLGLRFTLCFCEALFNRGLCYFRLQRQDDGMRDLRFAAQKKRYPDHDVIDEAINERAEGHTVFSIAIGLVYRPCNTEIEILNSRAYSDSDSDAPPINQRQRSVKGWTHCILPVMMYFL